LSDGLPGGGIYGKLIGIGMLLIFIGVGIALLGILLPILTGGGRVRGEGGAVIIIGPIPIVLASNPETAKWLMILAIILVVIVAALFFLLPSLLAHQAAGTAIPP